ncbi:hypothetical protein IMCC14465_03220 [alpha proteobacterium IMCC14465]|uniref:Uncharacterized protein n=1 Tax=alpha proteobacterium IMCC14465 TaxID=1220535 RepID=J9DIK2_9PROT|nr:hypothetical protein IMCC14465_03220 [alpha proteobacterium IMCC14465]
MLECRQKLLIHIRFRLLVVFLISFLTRPHVFINFPSI